MSRPARVAVRVLALLAALLTGAGLALLYGRAAPDAQPVRRVETIGASSQGRPLTLVTVGDPGAATRVLMLGCIHGDECGAVPVLDRLLWATPPPGVAYLLVTHPNPDGESAGTRQNGRGVDLNRNFPGFEPPPRPNHAYAGVHGFIVPSAWPPSADDGARMAAYVQAHGERALQAAISGGQHTHPEGLFYGGVNPTWSNVTLRHVLREDAHRARRLAWIDLHTGLGPSGHGEHIFAGRDDAAELARARRWWGERQITSIYDGSSTSAPLTGLMYVTAYEECPQAEYTGIALEYGTKPLMEVMDALRADQWLENHPETDEAVRTQIKRRVRDAFYTDTDTWKGQVLAQARQAALQAVQGLGAT